MSTIIIRNRVGEVISLDAKPFSYESLLEKSIAEVEGLLPLAAINDEAANYVTLGRQWAAGPGTADVVLLGSDALLTIVETKLKKNPEARRSVIAQIVEYAAYASEWSLAEIALKTEAYYQSAKAPTQDRGLVFDALVQRLLHDSADSVEQFKEKVQQNLAQGRVRLVVAMDEVGEQVQKIITFVNASSTFDIFALQISEFAYEDFEIFVPTMFGYARKTSSSTSAKAWTWDELVSEVGFSSDHVAYARRLTEKLVKIAEEWSPEVRLHYGWSSVRCFNRELFGVQLYKNGSTQYWFTLKRPPSLSHGAQVRQTNSTVYLFGSIDALPDEALREFCVAALKEAGRFE
jgi:hypothetical protein